MRADYPLREKSFIRDCSVGRGFVLALAFILLCFSPTIDAQCALGRLNSNPKGCGAIVQEKLLPESGFLSSDSYTNRFFGFSLDLPISSEGHRITIPVMMEKQHALLAIGYEWEKHFGTFVITAEESPRELPWYQDLQEEHCNDALKYDPQTRPEIPGMMLRFGSFYANQRHSGRNRTHHYWTRMKDYIIRVAVDSNDPEFLQKSKLALIKAQFYCARYGGQLATAEGRVFVPPGEPYQGPTVPTWLVDAAIKDQPGLAIPAGVVREGVYHNQELGLQYEFPKEWNSIPAETNEDPPHNARQRREYELFHACSRTLLHVVPRGSNVTAAQGSRPAIILRALDPSCLAMRTPASVGDKRIANEISAEMELSSQFGELKSDELISLEDRLFVVFRGTIGLRAPDEVLSRRMSEALFVTQHHNLLLSWSLMAPSSAQLDEIAPSSINFEGSPPIRLPPAGARP